MEQLANALARERVQLEFLLYKVGQFQQALRADDLRYLRWAAQELRRANERLAVTGRLRQEFVRVLAADAGLTQSEIALDELAVGAPEPWRSILADHRDGFRRLSAEIRAVILVTSALARASGHAAARVLDELGVPAPFAPAGYGRSHRSAMLLP